MGYVFNESHVEKRIMGRQLLTSLAPQSIGQFSRGSFIRSWRDIAVLWGSRFCVGNKVFRRTSSLRLTVFKAQHHYRHIHNTIWLRCVGGLRHSNTILNSPQLLSASSSFHKFRHMYLDTRPSSSRLSAEAFVRHAQPHCVIDTY